MSDRRMAELAVEDLHSAGLVHLLGGFVFATRAAVRSHELDTWAVSREVEGFFGKEWPRHGFAAVPGPTRKESGFLPMQGQDMQAEGADELSGEKLWLVTVPVVLVERLREGVFVAMGAAAQAIDAVVFSGERGCAPGVVSWSCGGSAGVVRIVGCDRLGGWDAWDRRAA